MDNNLISEILDNLDNIRNDEYNKGNFKPKEKIIFVKKCLNPNKETMDLKIFKYKVSQTIYKREKKYGELENINMGNDLNNSDINIFNLTTNNTEKITWRQLSIEERCKKLNTYFNNKNESFKEKYDKIYYKNEIIDEIIVLTKDKKILYKKHINYDDVKNRVISVNCIKYDEEKDTHIFIKSKKKKKKLSAKEIFK